MPVAVDPIGIQRVRRTDAAPQVTVTGTGFSPANNAVSVSGSPAGILTQSTTQITFNLPFPFSFDLFEVRDIHVPVVITNQDTGEKSADAYLWIKGDLDEVADEEIDTAIPGPFERTGAPERPRVFEARDMQRLAALIELLTKGVPDGNVVSHDGSKLAFPGGLVAPGAGQVLTVDPADPTGLTWKRQLDVLLRFGGNSSNGFPSPMVAGGSMGDTFLGRENWALADGTLDLINLDLRTSGGGTLDRVRLLVNGGAAYDSGTGLGAGLFYIQPISVAVTEGDQIELEITSTAVLGHAVIAVGGVRLLID